MRGIPARLLTISAIAALLTIAPAVWVQAQSIAPGKPQADRLFKTGSDYLKQNVLVPASQSLEQALSAYRAIADIEGQRAVLLQLAIAEVRLGKYDQAFSRTQQAQALPGRHSSQGAILSTQGSIQLERGNYREALRLFRAAAGGQGADIGAETRNRLGIGETLHALGFYTQALDVLLLAIRAPGDLVDQGRALNAIADVYFSLGQYDTAKTYYNQALAVRQGVGDWLSYDRTLQSLGRVSQVLKQLNQSQTYYQQALKGMTGRGDQTGKVSVFRGMAQLAAEQANPKQALSYYEQALATTRLAGDAGRVAVLNDLGFFYKSQNQFESAIATLEDALRLARRNGDVQGEIRALSGIGETRLQLDQKLNQKQSGQAKQASKVLQTAIERFESLRPGLRDADKVALFETHAHIYRLQQQALIRQNQPAQALAIAERGRARAFVELLSQRSKEEIANIQPPTVTEIQTIAKQQRATIVTYSIIYGANHEESELYSWVVKPTGEINFRQVDLSKLQNRPNSIDTPTVPSRGATPEGSDSFITNFVMAIRGTITQPTESASEPSTVLSSTQTAYQILIQSIADLLPRDGTARVIFIPQDALFLVPFAALQDAKGQYLIQKHSVQVSPSIQALTLARSRLSNQKSALIVGNPTPMPNNLPNLPGSEREATAIAQLLNTQAIVGREATKSRVLKRISQASIIHLATHGLLNDRQALQSSLALSASDQGGLLTAEEIFDLRLGADLAVLSACNTGRGKITGDGVIGLSRSLMSAGVPSVVVSLWLVPDEATAYLMNSFYRQLKQGSDKARALQQAMLDTQKKYPDPKDWAGFTLVGTAD
ncbi:CHAT domain-containing tetratricopeptide repeat protein [Phormidesmis sp. 146-35]